MMHYEDLFEEVGHFGKYQIWLYIILGLLSVFPGYQNIIMNFLGPKQDHWCSVPRLSNFTYQQQKYISIPMDNEGNYKSCKVFNIHYDKYSDSELMNWNRSWNQNKTEKSCSSWVFDQSEFVSTAVSQYNLVCGRAWLSQLVSTMYVFGMFVGAVSSGAASDRFGRKLIVTIGIVGQVIWPLLAAFAPNYPLFVILRFLTAVFNMSSYTSAFVIIMEIIGRKWRVETGMFYQIFFSAGFMLLPGVSYFVRDARKLQIILALLPMVTWVFPWIIPESPRWLMVQGRTDECLDIFKKIGRINGRPLPEKTKLTLKVKEEKDIGKKNILDLFKTKNMRRRTLIVYLIWFTCTLMYYGLSLNTGKLSGSVFLNTFLSGAVEIPANIIGLLALSRAGRRWTVGLSLLIASIFQYSQIAILLTKSDQKLAWLMTTTAMLGKAAVTVSFSSIYVFTADLMPTELRNLGLGSSSTVARLGGMGAPYVGGPLSNVWLALPNVIFGSLSTMAGLFTFILPETLNTVIPDTVEEAEVFGTKHMVAGEINMAYKDDSPDRTVPISTQSSQL